MGIPDFSISASNQSSSVAELIEEIQDRIPSDKIGNILPAINRAIRIISKRLFSLKSDLIIGSLSTPIYHEVEYGAATIAFVTGTPPTITDSASAFVTEEFSSGMYIETNSTTNPGPYRIVTVAAGTLTLHRANSVTTAAAGTSVTLTSLASYAPLPDDFWGLCERPNINGKTWTLSPLPARETALQYTSAGEPYWYRIKGSDIWVYPSTSSDITINGDYWKKPSSVTQMQDYVPFFQLLDDAIQEFVVIYLGGGSAITAEALQTFLEEAVDIVVSQRSQSAAVQMPEGINYEALYGYGQ